MKLEAIKTHAIAEALPEMSSEEFESLVKDIEEHGLREPIVIYEGSVLDGRHRMRAIEQLGWELKDDYFVEFDPEENGDPAQFAISMNIQRRNLTPVQRAASAIALLKSVGKKRKSNGEKKGMTVAEAAAVAGTTPQRVHELKQIESQAPEIAEEVRSGKKSLTKGLRDAELKGIQKEHEKSLDRIEKICGEEFAEQVRQGSIRFSPSEVVEFASMQDEVMGKLAPVLEAGTSWPKARGLIGMECGSETRVRQLWELCRMEPTGLYIYENETKEFKITVKQNKRARKTK